MNKKNTKETPSRKKATTPAGREAQLIALAVDAVEKRLRDGTATSAEIIHYLKLASSNNDLERQKKEEEVKLLRAKTENLQSAQNLEELYKKAMQAMTEYQGRDK